MASLFETQTLESLGLGTSTLQIAPTTEVSTTDLTYSISGSEGETSSDPQAIIMDNFTLAMQVLFVLNSFGNTFLFCSETDDGGYRDSENKSESHVPPDQWILDHPHAGMITIKNH